MNIQGKVILVFVLEKDGSISNIEIDKGVSTELDRETIRTIKKIPKWSAA